MSVYKVEGFAPTERYALVEAMSEYDAKRYIVETLDPVERERPDDFDTWAVTKVFSGVQFFNNDPVKKTAKPAGLTDIVHEVFGD